MYAETDVRMLELVRRAKLLDVTLPEMRKLVAWASTGTCDDFRERFLESVRCRRDDVARSVETSRSSTMIWCNRRPIWRSTNGRVSILCWLAHPKRARVWG